MSNDIFPGIQKTVDAVIVPSDIGRLPRKLASGFDGLTADEWRNWITVFSPIILRQLLSDNQWRNWKKFIFACKLLCSRSIILEALDLGTKLLIEFCQEFVHLYGADKCTPNIHLHCHLVDSIRDCGPVYTFWLFSFEWYNGILGHFHTNNQNIETQFVARFLEKQRIISMEGVWPDDLKNSITDNKRTEQPLWFTSRDF
jgi:hypothetical protein